MVELIIGGIMQIKTNEVHGFHSAIKGMRNPMNSWSLSDSEQCEPFILGEKDMVLAKKLIRAGTEHCKFLRQIQVWVDFDMPRYFWQEFDTYAFVSKNSSSTMHKLFNPESCVNISMFEYYPEDEYYYTRMVDTLNDLRSKYLQTKDFQYVRRAKRMLPESFLQLRTVNTNYAQLINMYHQRKTHKLKEEWVDTFCRWVETLPYMKDFLEV